jgi:DNA polymerase sigma
MWSRLGRTFGRILQKRRCDVLNEQDSDLVKKWWDIASTISPNTKDVKRRRIFVKTFEQHPTHYLQES